MIDTDVDNPLLSDLGVTVGESRGEQDPQGNYSGVVNVIIGHGPGGSDSSSGSARVRVRPRQVRSAR